MRSIRNLYTILVFILFLINKINSAEPIKENFIEEGFDNLSGAYQECDCNTDKDPKVVVQEKCSYRYY